SAQGLSLFNSQVSATYYNPAALTKDPRGELATGILHAEHELKAASKGGPAAPVRKGDVLQNTPSQHGLVGMKTNVGSLTTLGIPVYLGFIAGVEKYGKEMLAFESETSPEGQFLEYGRQPLFLNLGGAGRRKSGAEFRQVMRPGSPCTQTLHCRPVPTWPAIPNTKACRSTPSHPSVPFLASLWIWTKPSARKAIAGSVALKPRWPTAPAPTPRLPSAPIW